MSSLAAGDHLGSYEILESIGAGGMGVVYRARDTKLRRTVALKVLPDSLAADPERMARFEREARVLASLNHPNIAQLYGIEQGALVMEMVAGKSPKGPMPFPEAWKIAAQVAEALEYAHENGVVHRDLKPANIKLTPEGTVKLLDFGLAKALAKKGATSEESGEAPTVTMDATQPGMIFGTPAYMSPEQVKGLSVGQGADIWAFGVMLYELLTGRLPFRGESASEMMAAVLHEAPDLDPIPPRARPLLLRCLEKDPKTRLRHIGDVPLLLGSDTTAAPSRPRPRLLAGALAIALFLLAGLSFLHLREQSPPRDEVRLSVVLPEKSRALSLAVSPDGHAIAMVLVREGKQQVWIRELAGQEPVALAGTDGAADPFWSPNSRSVAFFADAKLKTVDRSGGPVQTLCDALGAQGGTWNQNGDILLGALGSVQRIPAGGGTAANLPGRAPVSEIYPIFLPDGRHYLATRGGNPGSPQTGIWLSSIDENGSRRLLPDRSNAAIIQAPPRSDVGQVLFTRDGALMAMPFDMKRLEQAGDPFVVAQGIAGESPHWLAATSSGGMLAYASGHGGGRQYVWRDRQGRNLGAIGDAGNVVMISPDGKELTGDRGNDIWVLEFARGNVTRLTFAPPNSFNPIWSPDGRYIAYGKVGHGIYRKPSNGAGAEELLLPVNRLAVPKSWSPDGRFIVYDQINPGTGSDLLGIPVDNDRKPFVVVQSPASEGQGQFSPDGHWVAYTSNESGLSEIYVIPFPPSSGEGKWMVSKGGGVQPRWRKDGKELFYISPDSKMMSVEVNSQSAFQAGNPQPLFQTDMVDTGIRTGPLSWDLAPDGNRFLIITANPTEGSSLRVALNWLPAFRK